MSNRWGPQDPFYQELDKRCAQKQADRRSGFSICDWCKKKVGPDDLRYAWDWRICPECFLDLEKDAHELREKKRKPGGE